MPVCVSPQDREASKSNAVCWPFIAPCCGFIPSDAPSPLRTPEDSQTYEHISRSILPVSVRPVSGEDDPAWSPAPVQARKRGRQIEKTHNTEGLGAENISMFFSNSIANKKGFLPRLSPFRAWTGAGNQAGSSATDTGRHISGSWTVGWNVALVPTIGTGGAAHTVSSQGHEVAYNASTELVTQPFHAGFDSARVWDEHDGAEFVPAHIRIPVILYLGNST